MRELEGWEAYWVNGGCNLEQHTYSFAVANMLTFAGISALLSLGLGKEVFIAAILAEGIYGGAIYYLARSPTPPSQQIHTEKGALPSIILAQPT